MVSKNGTGMEQRLEKPQSSLTKRLIQFTHKVFDTIHSQNV